MAFGSIELTTISRTQDYTSIKHNEDNKSMTDQNNIGQQVQKEANQKPREVHSSDNSDWHNRKFDAKEKGGNEYNGDGGQRGRREKNKEQVVAKGHQGFDIKI